MPPSKHTLRQLPASLIAALLAWSTCGPVSAAATPKYEGQIEVWTQACNGLSVVSKRTGHIQNQDIMAGMQSLHRAGLLNVLGQLSAEEACLTLAAAGNTATPALVLFSQVSPQDRQRIHPSALEHLRSHYELEFLAERLSDLGLNLAPNVSGSSLSAPEATVYANRGVLAGANRHERSFAALGNGLCVVALKEAPLSTFLATRQTNVWNMLDPQAQQAIQKLGDAYEYWHEVGHCDPDATAKLLSGASTAASQLDTWADRRYQESLECSTASAQQLWQQIQDRKASGQTPFAPIAADQKASIRNQGIHFALIKESLSDQFAEKMVSLKLKEAPRGCADERQINTPWQSLRLAWSIRDPDARYMTWLIPWLSGLPETVQHQVMVDTHQGLMLAAKDLLQRPLYLELINSRLGRPDKHTSTDPAGKADPERAQAWAQWATRALSGDLKLTVISPDH